MSLEDQLLYLLAKRGYTNVHQAPRIRLLAKFVEKNYQVPNRLLQIRSDYASRVQAVDREINAERAPLSDKLQKERGDEWDSRRLDGGLYVLQTVDVILAWLVAEDEGAKIKIQSLLEDQGDGLRGVKATLQGEVVPPIFEVHSWLTCP